MIASESSVQLFEVVACLARKCWWAPALRGVAAACWWVGGALKLWVWPVAGGAAVDVSTAPLLNLLHISQDAIGWVTVGWGTTGMGHTPI